VALAFSRRGEDGGKETIEVQVQRHKQERSSPRSPEAFPDRSFDGDEQRSQYAGGRRHVWIGAALLVCGEANFLNKRVRE